MARILEKLDAIALWQYTEENWQTNKKALFGNMPPVIRDIVAFVVREIIYKQIYGQGLGMHSEEEIFHLGKADLDALSTLLGTKDYFLGDDVASLDASAFWVLINTLCHPIESPIKEHASSKDNIRAYCDRMMIRYFPEFIQGT